MKYPILSKLYLRGKTEVVLDTPLTNMPAHPVVLDAQGNHYQVLRFTYPRPNNPEKTSLLLAGNYKDNQIELLDD